MTVSKFSGGMGTNATVFDQAASNTGTSTVAALTLNPATAGELIAACTSFNASVSGITPGADYLLSNSTIGQGTEYRQVSTTSETAPLSWTNSVQWVEIAGAYIPMPAAGNFMGFF